ncbi:hypothetical protein SAMN02800694_1810 [Luteibacter sp. UNCMF331Sha3.1]|nr:hypothetical protein SAMN02800694_1810 [Luteibacter sp. UNCMF331Sha3.1]
MRPEAHLKLGRVFGGCVSAPRTKTRERVKLQTKPVRSGERRIQLHIVDVGHDMQLKPRRERNHTIRPKRDRQEHAYPSRRWPMKHKRHVQYRAFGHEPPCLAKRSEALVDAFDIGDQRFPDDTHYRSLSVTLFFGITSPRGFGAPRLAEPPKPRRPVDHVLNALASCPRHDIVIGHADGSETLIDPSSRPTESLQAATTPDVSGSESPFGDLVHEFEPRRHPFINAQIRAAESLAHQIESAVEHFSNSRSRSIGYSSKSNQVVTGV